MTTREETSLRTRLKNDTRAFHEELDDMVSRFDLTTPRGLSSFLHMQSMALRTIEPHAERAASCSALRDLLRRADSDLCLLETRDRQPARVIGPLHPLAIDYVIAGSRLGTQVLRQKWKAATDPRVLQADAYFSAPRHVELWKSFCLSTEAMSPLGGVADQIVGDACLLFRLYADFARPRQTTDEAIHA